MRGVVMHAPGDFRVEEREDPKILKPTDAVIRVAAACVCGSDLWPYRGAEPFEARSPIGHEYVGGVQEVGSAVTTVKPGQFVVGGFSTSDNTCANCLAGYQTSCVQREWMNEMGAQAERLRVPLADGTLVATPDTPDADLIPSLLTASDVLGTGWFAAVAAQAGPGRTVAVVGDGAVGLLGVLAARQLGAEHVIAVSRHASRQKLALAGRSAPEHATYLVDGGGSGLFGQPTVAFERHGGVHDFGRVVLGRAAEAQGPAAAFAGPGRQDRLDQLPAGIASAPRARIREGGSVSQNRARELLMAECDDRARRLSEWCTIASNESRPAHAECPCLRVWPTAAVLAIFRFRADDEVDFDVDLRGLQGQDRLEVFCSFLRKIGRRLGKPVLMDSEGDCGCPVLGFDAEADRVVLLVDLPAGGCSCLSSAQRQSGSVGLCALGPASPAGTSA